MSGLDKIAQACIVTAEVMGHELSPLAAGAMARELGRHDPAGVTAALRRCGRELSGRLSLAKVLERIPGAHPGANEAWAMCPRSEDETVVWTNEISAGFAAAAPLLRQGDQVAARMAFKDAYSRAVATTERPVWTVSMGHDKDGRAAPIRAAVEAGLLPAERAAMLLPPGHAVAALPSGTGTQKLGVVLK